ncbi:MAG: glycosyltransferase [Halobacteriovoraceae bacterium]|nr:glycosyltransferase [Halobacteriovoraceae bacterium]
MKKVILNILYSPIDHDSRVQKEIESQKKIFDVVSLIDIQSKKKIDGVVHLPLDFQPKRYFHIRGFSHIVLLLKFLRLCFRNFNFLESITAIHCNDIKTLLSGVILKIFFSRGAILVYDAHEFETEVNNLKSFNKFFLKVFEKILLGWVDRIITVSPAIAEYYKAVSSSSTKVFTVRNTSPFQESVARDLKKELGLDKEEILYLYQGGLSKNRGIELILDVFKQLPDRHILFLGNGHYASVVKEASKIHSNIHYHEAVPSSVLLQYTASCDVGLLFYENTCLNHYYCLPNKIFEYLMAGIPVITSDLWELKQLVKSENIGRVSAYDKEQIISLLSTLTKNEIEEFQVNVGRTKKIYSWEVDELQLLRAYSD